MATLLLETEDVGLLYLVLIQGSCRIWFPLIGHCRNGEGHTCDTPAPRPCREHSVDDLAVAVGGRPARRRDYHGTRKMHKITRPTPFEPAHQDGYGLADISTTCSVLAAAGVVTYLGPVVTEEQCRCVIRASERVNILSIEDYLLRNMEGGELADGHYIRRWRTLMGDESCKYDSQAVGLEPQQRALAMEEGRWCIQGPAR
ncbi:hypothetical protein CGRA01v4_07026 [Colletotrichum graminicola]|nr:hypothetical protein CGRA01v4_07026 [Colletotrichum graminicola]